MKLTQPQTIDESEKELIQAVCAAIDWNAIRQQLTNRHLNNPSNRFVFRNGDLVIHDNRIAYQLGFDIRVPLSIILNREGKCLDIVSACPDDEAVIEESSGARMEMKERSSEKVEQLAASIADMINEINQSEDQSDEAQ